MEPSSQHQVVCFGEVLWDILPSAVLPGGTPMNVAYHLKKLGTNPALVTKIGMDNYGEKMVNMLAANGITTDFFYVDYEHQTGLVYAIINDHQEVVYNIVYPSAWDFIELKDELTALVKEAGYFVFGSLTSRNKVSRDTLIQLMEMANTKVLDINLRPPHFQRSNVEYLLQKADILKISISELELITGWFSHFPSIEDRAKIIQDQFNINTVIVTMGCYGAMVSHQGTIHRHPGFKIEVADTIGTGDSFLAGFLSQLLEGASIDNALAFASGISAFVATQAGACPEYHISQITTLINSASSSELGTHFLTPNQHLCKS